jgi:hypothetical protein
VPRPADGRTSRPSWKLRHCSPSWSSTASTSQRVGFVVVRCRHRPAATDGSAARGSVPCCSLTSVARGAIKHAYWANRYGCR